MLIIKTEEDRERCTSCYGNMKATQEGKSFHIFEEDKPSENCSDGACDIKW